MCIYFSTIETQIKGQNFLIVDKSKAVKNP